MITVSFVIINYLGMEQLNIQLEAQGEIGNIYCRII